MLLIKLWKSLINVSFIESNLDLAKEEFNADEENRKIFQQAIKSENQNLENSQSVYNDTVEAKELSKGKSKGMDPEHATEPTQEQMHDVSLPNPLRLVRDHPMEQVMGDMLMSAQSMHVFILISYSSCFILNGFSRF